MARPQPPAARGAPSPDRRATAGLPGHRPDAPIEAGLTRRYEVACLAPSGDVETFSAVAPAAPAFEDAFATFARGTLVATRDGPVAVEDLSPGIEVETAHDGPQPLLWVGAMTLFPDAQMPNGGETGRLTRLAAEAFGLGRPMPDLVLGPRARILYRHPRCREILGTTEAFAPARAFVDGISVIEVAPVSPVRLYHLAFAGQRTILANGIEVESCHPGPRAADMMAPAMLDLFLGLFPHLDGLAGFGPMPIPRLTAFEIDTLRAA